MKSSRRKFLKKASLLGTIPVTGTYHLLHDAEQSFDEPIKGKYLTVTPPGNSRYYQPLERVNLMIDELDRGMVKVFDGRGNRYHQNAVRGRLNFDAGGYLGYHTIQLFDHRDNLMDQLTFPVNCKTSLKDDDGEFSKILDMLHWSIFKTRSGMGNSVRYNEKYYKHYSGWFQDTMYAVTRGMKYFIPDIEGGMDLYGDGQREDGMIFDNYKHPYTEHQSYWEYRFNYGDFVYRPEDPLSSCLFVKVPVENIGQYTFIEGLYYTWKALGDDIWLNKHIDKAVKAVDFTINSPYYWSDKFRLLRRPFTVDIWDFQPREDAQISGGDIMGYILGKTRTGIHFGDNIAFSNACHQLSEMLIHLEKNDEADRIKKLGTDIRARIDKLAWQGDYYLHHIPEDPDIDRDLGVEQSEQVSLSNALSLNRGLEHNKCVSIIRQYQAIREKMPDSSPGEWYTIYPPFGAEKFGRPQWQYMNGGVTPIVAGELARGAFEHGFEEYGVSILRRLYQLAQLKDNCLKGCYRGAMPAYPERNFTIIDMKDYMNTSKTAGNKGSVPGWIGSGKDDFRNLPAGRRNFHEIPFELIDPEINNEKTCLVLSGDTRFTEKVIIPVEGKHASLYLLHTATSNPVAGSVKITYEDDSIHHHYVSSANSGSGDFSHWWYPELKETRGRIPTAVIWWRGPSTEVKDVGLSAFGLNNPYPEKAIKNIVLENEDKGIKWAVFGLTLSDHPVFFMPDIESTIPDHWASAHVVYGLVEGLVGIQDGGVAFNKAVIAPRWEAAGKRDVKATAKYEASGGYVSYKYRYLEKENKMLVEFTGNSENTVVKVLIPKDKILKGVYCDREICRYDLEHVENSDYAVFEVEGIGTHIAEIRVE